MCKYGGSQIFHVTHIMEVGNPKFIQCILKPYLSIGGLSKLGLKVISRILSGEQYLSLLFNFVFL